MTQYNKLVRDKIPELIALDGDLVKTRILNDREYKKQLLRKLVEEAREVKDTKGNDPDLSVELADLLEVVDHIFEAFNLDKTKVQRLQVTRRKIAGGFKKRVFLESTEDKAR